MRASKRPVNSGVVFRDWGFRLWVLDALHDQGLFKAQFLAAAKATEFTPPHGEIVYTALTSEWDGEDDLFEVKSLIDIKHLPNVVDLTLMACISQTLKLDPLVKVPNLSVFIDG